MASGVDFVRLPSSQEECCICKENMSNKNEQGFGHIVGQTQHLFHQVCVGNWFARQPAKPFCPLCMEPVLNASKFIPLGQQECVMDYAFHGREADVRERLAFGGLTEMVRSNAIILAITSPFASHQTAKTIVNLLLENGSIPDRNRDRARNLAAACRPADVVSLLEKTT